MVKTAPPPLPQPGEGKRGEQGYLGYLLRQAAGAYRKRVEHALSDLGVTPPQFSVLTMLAAYPGHSNADLARLALLTPQTVSVIIANLEKAGSVSRQKHAVHGRIQQLDLTERGRALLARATQRVHAVEHELLRDLSDQDQLVVRQWLVRVALTVATKS
jgi:DNA-binding MarR family transcriptional regulator